MKSEKKANDSLQVKRFFWMYFVFAAIALVGGTISIYYRINGVTPALLSAVGTDNANTVPNLNAVQQNLQQLQQNANSNVNLLTNGANGNVTTNQTNPAAVNSNATVSADKLRAQLEQLGMSSSDLSQISDQELMSTYADLTNQYANTNVDVNSLLLANVNSVTNQQQVDSAANLNANQIRSLLEQYGVPETQLQGVNDAQLIQMYQQTLNQQTNQTTN